MKIKKAFFLFAFLLLFKNVSHAVETYVYCADENKNWYWLSKGTIKVEGRWETEDAKNGLYFNYFIITKGLEEVQALRERCLVEFGASYIYAQPADSSTQRWSLFAIDENTLVDGIVTLRPYNY